jgi:hypothetical protein
MPLTADWFREYDSVFLEAVQGPEDVIVGEAAIAVLNKRSRFVLRHGDSDARPATGTPKRDVSPLRFLVDMADVQLWSAPFVFDHEPQQTIRWRHRQNPPERAR